jgi:SecY interacting protein Syd|tara:strand:+ start:7266 stop:7808 length:543 start_codon:yes stop_codon:yes gene_type:complete
VQALTEFIDATLSNAESGLLSSPFHADWRSPSELHQALDLTYWKPIRQQAAVSFEGLSHALELEIHPDIVAYYTSYWSGTLEADSAEGRVSLIQLWNLEDFDRLIANLVGHAMAKQKSREAFTVFIANTDPDTEIFLSIDNSSGAVLLEEPGKPPLRQVETDIHTFLRRLKPNTRPADIY